MASNDCIEANQKFLLPQTLSSPITKVKNFPGQILKGHLIGSLKFSPFPNWQVLCSLAFVQFCPLLSHPKVTPARLLKAVDSKPRHVECREGIIDFVLVSHHNAFLLYVLNHCGFSKNGKLSFLCENLNSSLNRQQLSKQCREFRCPVMRATAPSAKAKQLLARQPNYK